VSQMFWYGPAAGDWGYGWMALTSLVFWALVVVAVVLLVRHFSGTGGRRGTLWPPGPASQGGAEQLLAERYARGEISTEEYRERLRTLREEAGTPAGSRP
jgi:putative membrane protein